jgi:hypothetical protein
MQGHILERAYPTLFTNASAEIMDSLRLCVKRLSGSSGLSGWSGLFGLSGFTG